MKRWGYVITGIMAGMLAAMVIRDSTLSQIGGGDECLCATQVATATQQMVISPTPLATPTDGSAASPTPLPMASPTILPMPTGTLPARDNCWHKEAGYRKGWDYQYLDRNSTGWYQRIRGGPSTSYAVVGYLPPNVRKEIYFTYNGWEALDTFCRQWVLNSLGELLPRSTN